jgi:hypothetical protein
MFVKIDPLHSEKKRFTASEHRGIRTIFGTKEGK